jgi:hypothetical protein
MFELDSLLELHSYFEDKSDSRIDQQNNLLVAAGNDSSAVVFDSFLYNNHHDLDEMNSHKLN